MLDGREGKARRRRWSCSCATPRRSAPSGSSIRRTSPACRARRIRFCRTITRTRAPTASTRSSRTSISTPTSSSMCRSALVPTCHLQGGGDPQHWQTLGMKVEVFRNYQEREAFAAGTTSTSSRPARRISPGMFRHGRALRVDGIVGRDLRQLRARCAHQHRGTREHERSDAHRQDSGLGSAPYRESLRHAPHRRGDDGGLGDGLGHARLLRRRRRAGADPCHCRRIQPARDCSPQALRRGGLELRRRRDVPHRRRDTGSRMLEMAFGPKTPPRRSYGKTEQRRVYDRLNASASDPMWTS